MELSKKMAGGLKIAAAVLIALLLLAIGMALGARWSNHGGYSHKGFTCGRDNGFVRGGERGEKGCNKQFKMMGCQGGENNIQNDSIHAGCQFNPASNINQINNPITPSETPDLNVVPVPVIPNPVQ